MKIYLFPRMFYKNTQQKTASVFAFKSGIIQIG
jgi:hypothetical protein